MQDPGHNLEQLLSGTRIRYTNRIVKGQDNNERNTINQYSIIRVLGEGAFGEVKLVRENETNEKFAMKIYSKSRLRKQKDYQKNEQTGETIIKNAYLDTLREIRIMARLGDRSGSVIKLHEVIDSEDDDKLILILDFASFGEIMSWDDRNQKFETCLDNRKMFNELDIQRIIRDCLLGLDFLHKNGIVHRDIKPLNIMLDENGIAKFADFGASVILEDRPEGDRFFDTTGTYHFLAPEVCNPEVKEYSGIKSDIWSLGVTFYCLVFNLLPFGGESDMEIQENILKNDLTFPASKEINPGLKDIICRMMDKDPDSRISIDDLKENEWLNEGFHFRLSSEEVTHGIMCHLKAGENVEISKEAIEYAKKLVDENKVVT